jgi:hypothetical protein
MVALIGPPPSDFARRSETMEQCFDPSGKYPAIAMEVFFLIGGNSGTNICRRVDCLRRRSNTFSLFGESREATRWTRERIVYSVYEVNAEVAAGGTQDGQAAA